MEKNCIFCRIAAGEIKSDRVYDGEDMVVFKDIHPISPVHWLAVPKKHISTLNDLGPGDKELVGGIFLKIAELASQHKIAADGYRVVANCNKNGGQEVFHVHFHVLGGKQLNWPPE
ncbi:MAG: histidine triad nucleotide-binding protein [Candidatus Omnitrophica bacterium]|nr:histidine triad nucleotide-binding protein [Candidatus Omnitrophota bacterium]